MSPDFRPARKLGFRFAFLLAIALLPLGVISGLQASALLKETRARSEAALLGATRSAAAQELNAVQRAQGAAEAIAQTVPLVIGDLESCNRLMRGLVEASDVYSFAGFYDTNGDMECSSAGRPFSFGRTPELEESIKDPKPSVWVNQEAPLSKTSVLFAQHPVFGVRGELLGFTAVSMPHSALSVEDAVSGKDTPLMIVTFNSEGDIITSSVGLDEAEPRLPRDRSLTAFVGGEAVAFTARSNQGAERAFSVVPLVPGVLYALGSWPAERLPGVISWSSLPPWAVPGLMWVVSLSVALVAAERLVTRHIKTLTRAITSFAGGNRLMSEMDLEDAPLEISEAADAFDSMRKIIVQDEAELEDTVHQKEVLLREVHHRVKNNLQLIASIMNMQSRRAHSPEAKYVIKRLQERVMSLATIHRGLYQTTGVVDVRVDELLQDILRQILNMAAGPDKRFDVDTQLAPLRLTPDQAVPLALLVTEALTNAMKYAGGETAGRAELSLVLRSTDTDRAELVISNSLPAEDAPLDEDAEDGSGLGTQLVEAFVQQLGGTIERTTDDGRFRLTVAFPVQTLREGEEREAIGKGAE